MTKDFKPEPKIKPPVKKERKLSTSEYLDDIDDLEEEPSFWDQAEREALEPDDGSWDNSD